MNDVEVKFLREELSAAMGDDGGPLAAADRLCHACVELLEIDGASISLVHQATTVGTFGSSSELSRRIDEWQFTYGEGPCMDAVSGGAPVLVADLGDRGEYRWPAFSAAVLGEGIRGVFALPVAIASSWVGALDLFNHAGGPLTERALVGGLLAAELATLPLLDLMTANVARVQEQRDQDPWDQLASLERVEVYQATGILIASLDVSPAEALVRLRAHAFVSGTTASEVAYAIIERRLILEADGVGEADGRASGGLA